MRLTKEKLFERVNYTRLKILDEVVMTSKDIDHVRLTLKKTADDYINEIHIVFHNGSSANFVSKSKTLDEAYEGFYLEFPWGERMTPPKEAEMTPEREEALKQLVKEARQKREGRKENKI